MRFTTKTEYGLICLIYIATRGEGHPVTIKEIVQAEGFSLPFTEKILQKLRAAKIVAAQHGNQGGYVLAKSPAEITFKDIVEALEGRTFEVFCEPKVRKEIVCTHFSSCGVSPIWMKTKELLDNFFTTITLEIMIKNALKPDVTGSTKAAS